jgi:CDP-6-deoxy-D-xylo-4-hexulose-3-dehydrase
VRDDGSRRPDARHADDWSFYHPHHLSSFGGGAVLSLDEEMQRVVESVSHWGRACTCHVDDLPCRAPVGASHQFTYVRPGHNLEMSELNAAFGRHQLARWPAMEQARKDRYAILFDALADSPLLTWAPPERSGSPFVFPFAVRGGSAEALASRLAARGVETRTLMGGPIADQPAYRGVANDGNANARELSRRSLFVGVHQTLPIDDVRAVAAILRDEAFR